MKNPIVELQVPSHDAYFRAIFSDLRHAEGLLGTILPKEIAICLELSQLRRIEDSFPAIDGGEIRADLVFLCPLTNSTQFVEIAIVFEHKSYRDNRAKEQLLHEWLHLRQKRRHLPIIPVLFYHGARVWTPTTFREEARDLPESIGNLQPQMPFVFVDLCRQNDEILSNHNLDGMSRLALYLLKKCPLERLHIGELFGLFVDAAKGGDSTGLGESWIYLGGRGGLEKDDLRHISRALVEVPSMRFKSTFEKMFDEAKADGHAVGLAEGHAEGITLGITQGITQGLTQGAQQKQLEVIERMLANDLPWDMIQKVTGMEQREYEALRLP